MLPYLPARLPGGVGHVAEFKVPGFELAQSLARSLHGPVSDVERPVQIHQQPPDAHAPMIAARAVTDTSRGRRPATPRDTGTRARVFQSTKPNCDNSRVAFRLWAGARDLELHFGGAR